MKSCLAIVFLFFCSISVHAQSVTLYDLINLSNLTNDQAHDFFVTGKLFKRLYQQNINGLVVDYYQTQNPAKREEITIGNGVRSSTGTLLRTVNYTTTRPSDLFKLIAQAKSAGLNVDFAGSDSTKNIYLFDNFLYTVHIYISIDNTNGIVQVQQKDFIDHEE